MRCSECNKPLLTLDRFAVCPDGHGKLIPINRAMERRLGGKRRIAVNNNLAAFTGVLAKLERNR